MKVMQSHNATSNESLIPPQDPIAPPTVLPSPPIETILNHLDELPLEHMEENIKVLGNGRAIIQRDFDQLETELQKPVPKLQNFREQMVHNDEIVLARVRISTPEMIIENGSQEDINIYSISHELGHHLETSCCSVATALEAQAATKANTENTNRNIEQRETHVERKCSYKEFMSCQRFNLKGTEGAVCLIHWFERTESVFFRSNCTEDCKVKFSTGTLTEEALSWWNSFSQPIGIEEAYKIPCISPEGFLPSILLLVVTIVAVAIVVEGWENEFHQDKASNLPLCKKCNLHHTGPCNVKCQTCKKVGHLIKNCKNKGPATGSNLQPVLVTCHACGEKGHFKSQCSKANNSAYGRAYLLREKNAHQDPNVVTGTFLLNKHLARVLFDSGADKSFVSISLATMLNIPPITLDTTDDIEMADRNLYHARIICEEKVVYIPIDGETLIIRVKEKKSDEKRLEDIPVVREFPEVFPEDLPGLPPVWVHLKANVIANAIRRKERIKPLRVRALVMTLYPKLPSQLLKAQTEAIKEENIEDENLRGMDKAFEIRPGGT
nr:hypothetical protein [Tanacetum cinerariifolium]